MSDGIIQCFLNTSMINGHDGLTAIAKKAGIKVSSITPGSYVVFVNAAQDRIKVFAANNVVAYVRLGRGRKVDLRVIREIPQVFSGASINYDEALEKVVTKALNRPTIGTGYMRNVRVL